MGAAAAIPIIIAVVGMGMQMKAAGEAQKAANFERRQAEDQAAAIRAEAVRQETERRLFFARSIQADWAQNAAYGRRAFFGGSEDARKKGATTALNLDVLTLRANAAAGIRTAGLTSAASQSRANAARTQAFGKAATFGLRAAQGFNTTRTAGANQTTVA